jgi:hypothetical protein
VVSTKVEDVFPKTPMVMDTKEALAECDKDQNMESRVRSRLIQLNLVNKEKSTKKFVDWNGQAAEKKVGENYPETLGRIWGSFIPWNLHRSIVRYQTQLLEVAVVFLVELGSFPSRNFFLLLSSGGTGGDVLGAIGSWTHGSNT